ncbi:MAG: hypothetical protein RSC04_04150 [Bacteroidales bacterium]
MQRFFYIFSNGILIRFALLFSLLAGTYKGMALQPNLVKAGFGVEFTDATFFTSYPFLAKSPFFSVGIEGDVQFVLANKKMIASSVYSYKRHSFAGEYKYEGSAIFNTQKARLIYVHHFSHAFILSFSTAYQWHNQLENRPSESVLNLALGLSYSISPKIYIYSQFANPIYVRSYDSRKRNKEFVIEGGLLYKITKSLALSLRMSKDPMYPIHIECGVAYQLGKSFLLSASSGLQPFQNKIGFNYCRSSFSLGFEFMYQIPLGYASSFFVSWRLIPKKERSEGAK